MTIFVVIPQPNSATIRLGPRIIEAYGDNVYQLEGGHGWIISTKETVKQLSDNLGITDGTNGAAVIVEVASYFGRANPSAWSWIKAKWEAGGD